jgi:hypothetical protein
MTRVCKRARRINMSVGQGRWDETWLGTSQIIYLSKEKRMV